MKRLLPVLVAFVVLDKGWSLPPSRGGPTSDWIAPRNWTDCVGSLIFSKGKRYMVDE
ncbi:hypothetical protein OAJ77_07750 [Rhodospirillales bacterium]|nr:hypothetical protein [Rhodospirillales bacterium]